MSIDGIGRPPIPPSGPGPLSGSGAPEAAGRNFELASSEVSTENEPLTLLSKLERGELTVDEYLEARVDDAVAPLGARLSPEQLTFVRESLKGELETDPVLVELVRRATQGSPAANER